MSRKGLMTPVGHSKAPSTHSVDPPRTYDPFPDTRIVVTVKLKSYDREERSLPLNLDISLRPQATSHHQTLLLEVTDESDPCFLYVSEFGESEFHALKEEQGVIVDFLVFPHMLAELFRDCECSQGSRYVQIVKSQSEATLSVVEINNFKQLTHISLRLRQGQNETLQRYMSKTLMKMKEDNEELKERVRDLEQTLDAELREKTSLSERYKALASDKERSETQAAAELKSRINDIKEQMMEQKLAQARLYEDEKRSLVDRFESEIAKLKAQLEDVSARHARLVEEKSALQVQYNDLTKNYRQIQHELELAMSQLEPLRADSLKLTSTQSSLERSKTELSLKIQNFEQQLKDKEGIIAKLNELTATLNEQKAQREEEIAILRSSKQKLEDKIAQSVQEIIKGNQIIEKLQVGRKAKREKLKLKSAVLLQQEEVINKKQQQIDESEREKYSLQREMALRDDRIREGEKAAEELKRQLEEAQRVLEETKHQITYLNREVTKTRTIAPAFTATSKPPTPSPYGSTFKPSGYNLEALRSTPTRSQLSPSHNSSTSELEPAPRLKDPVKYKEPLA